MTTFDDRQKAYEDKFAHDEELRFKATVKAAKLFGQWVAEQAGLPKDAYAQELVNLITQGKNEEVIIKKAEGDAASKGKKLSAEALSQKYAQCLNEAKQKIAAG